MSTTDQSRTKIRRASAETGSETSVGESDPGLIETVIRPRHGWIAVNWSELFHSHELFYTLIARDLKVRYKQTVLGVAWAVIQPLFTMVVFSVIFGRMVKVDSHGIPYPLFVLAALVPWTFFNNAVGTAALSLVTNHNMLSKVYFPRIFVPAATIGGFLVDMGIGLGLFAIFMPIYGFAPGWGVLALPFLVVLLFVVTLGIGLMFAAATTLYRDIRFVIPFGLQILMYVSPVIISMDKFYRPYQYLLALNPMFGIINAFRSSILGMPWDFVTLAISILSGGLMLFYGLFFFQRTERLIADIG